MNRQQFLDKLAAELSSLAPEERDEAMKFYVEYLDEAGPEKEEEVLKELGSPQKVAAIIRANLGVSSAAPEKEKVPQPELTLEGPDWSRKASGQAGPALRPAMPRSVRKTTTVCFWYCFWCSPARCGSAFWAVCSAQLWALRAAFWV